jgi:hypothetical protein
MPNTYTELLRTTVGTATASVTLDLTGISGYTDLVLVGSWSVTTGSAALYAQVGNTALDTGSNYSYTLLRGDGSSAASARQSNITVIVLDSVASSGLANCIVNFQNYSNTTTNKTILSRENNAAANVSAYVNLWRNTAAINLISLFPSASTFAVGSTFSLYGILAA